MLSALSLAVACVGVTVSAAGSQAAIAAKAQEEGLHLRKIASASSPVFLTSPTSEPGNLYVVEQRGVIRVIGREKAKARTFLNITGRVRSGGEQGLLSMAFDPGYAKNGFLYVDYTDLNGNTRVVRFRARGGKALRSSARRLLYVHQPYANHNGGQLQFGPDGKLYVGMGDGGSGGDPHDNGQNLRVRLGKLLRANVHAKKIRWSIAGYGLRNPWRFSFDRQKGDLYIGDVGQDRWEEVDYLPRAWFPRLQNYGWSVYEGKHSFKPSQPLNRRGRLVWPVRDYAHGASDARCSVTGGYVYRGQAQPKLRGRYFFGDYCSGEIWSFRLRGRKVISLRREPVRVPSLSSFGEDALGELYALSLRGAVYRIS